MVNSFFKFLTFAVFFVFANVQIVLSQGVLIFEISNLDNKPFSTIEIYHNKDV